LGQGVDALAFNREILEQPFFLFGFGILFEFFLSILAISVPISGKTKKLSSVSEDRNLIPLSVSSTWLFSLR
jgi:hypothetical protein